MAALPDEDPPSGRALPPPPPNAGKAATPRSSRISGCFPLKLTIGILCVVLLPAVVTWKLTIIIGLGTITLAGWLSQREHGRLKASQILPGTVVKIDCLMGSDLNNRYSYRPHVRYTSHDGVVRDFVPYTSMKAGLDVKLNEQIVVAYDAATQDASIVTFGQRFGVATFLAVIGAALVLLGAAFLTGRHFVPWVYTTREPSVGAATAR